MAQVFGQWVLSAQVAERIALGIRHRAWVGTLPGERTLAEMLHVSRKTVRKSLAQLDREKLVETNRGNGRRILAQAPTLLAQTRSICLLSAEPLEWLRTHTLFWVGELRTLLFEHQVHLEAFHGRRYFGPEPDDALAALMKENPMSLWVLINSTERIQRWLLDHGVPCVIVGSCHPRAPLPTVGLDYFSVCRHAAGAMVRGGHRRIAFLTEQSQMTNEITSEKGFADGMRRFGAPDVQSVVIHHDGTVSGAWRTLTQLFDSDRRPTAMLVARPGFFLTTMAFLAERGLRVPEDISLVSRDDDVFFSHLRPSPARYAIHPRVFAKRVHNLILAIARNETPGRLIQLIEPKFIPGDSLDKPRQP